MKNKFIETTILLPSERVPKAKCLINVNAINFIEEADGGTTWIILNGSKHHDILESIESYTAIRNQILDMVE